MTKSSLLFGLTLGFLLGIAGHTYREWQFYVVLVPICLWYVIRDSK